MSIATSQEKLDASILDVVFAKPRKIAGREVRNPTLASVGLLKAAKSELIQGKQINEIQNMVIECCIFVVLHTVPLPEAVALANGPREVLELKAYELAESINMHEVGSFSDEVMAMLHDAMSTKAVPVPDKKRKGGRSSLEEKND